MNALVSTTVKFKTDPRVTASYRLDIGDISVKKTEVLYGWLNKELWVEFALGEEAFALPFKNLTPEKMEIVILAIPSLKNINRFLVATIVAASAAYII